MNLSARISLTAALAIALAACGGRMDGGTGGGNGGTGGSGGNGGGSCAPFCGTGGGTAGTGGGTTGTGGGTTGTGGGTTGTGGGTSNFDGGQIPNAKRANFCSTLVSLSGVRVTAIDSQFVGAQGDARAAFWVADPTDPKNGLYVFKDFTDLVNGKSDGGVAIGDTLNISGFMSSLFPDFGAAAYRYEMRKSCSGTPTGMVVTTTSSGQVLADVEATAPFGQQADGGRPRGYTVTEQRFITPTPGARVHVPGPLTLSNPAPIELVQANNTSGSTVFGFEVTGAAIPSGMLVINSQTYQRSDGGNGREDGNPPCDYRQYVADGGRMVTFPNGIRGVWDTFAQSPCHNGMATCTGNFSRDAGFVPGTDAKFTFALIPMDCPVDFAGAVVTP